MAYLLIVDDDEDFTAAAKLVLETEGHEVAVALDIASGLKSIEARKPDLLILDVMFPENSTAGFDFARTIRNRHKDFGDMPILMLTAVNEKFPLGFGTSDIDEDWLPVQDFVEKPVDFDVLKAKVADMLQKSKADA